MKTISDEELASINRAVYIRYGIDFQQYEPVSLKRRFSRILERYGFETVFDLWRRVLAESDFIYTIIDEITVGLTEMFRNPELWLKVKERILPELKNHSRVDIWHAGCSTGEEVYTLAIVLWEAGFLHKTQRLATDLNRQAVAQAASGSYAAELLERYQTNFDQYAPSKSLSAYYSLKADTGLMHDYLKQGARFEVQNLTRDLSHEKFDIILCRNVLIYFDETLKARLIRQFYEQLKPGGFFIIGYYDAFPQGSKSIFENFDSSGKIYRRL